MSATLALLVSFLILFCVKAEIDHPQIPESWIYTMIIFGFIGFFGILCIIILSIHRIKTSKKNYSKIINFLNFTLWACSLIACFEWAFLRTNLFINLNKERCAFIYLSNYLFYMFGKFCLHILLLYRVYAAFRGTVLQINRNLAKIFASMICLNFMIFTFLWIESCSSDISVGVIMPSQNLQICTLFNNDSVSRLSFYETFWPILFGAQDFIVGISTLIIFVYKLSKLSTTPAMRTVDDIETEQILRKISILGTISICSTFIFYTFAITFYPNLTFLLPADAMLNSLCVFLLLEWSSSLYTKLCFAVDLCVQIMLKHQSKSEVAMAEINRVATLRGSGPSHRLQITMKPSNSSMTTMGLRVPSLRNLSSSNKPLKAFSSTASSRSRSIGSPEPMTLFTLDELTKIDNGMVGVYISPRVVKIAAEFWETYISNKPRSEKLEIGCTIYFGMMVYDNEIKNVLKDTMKKNSSSIEESSVKFLDMMEWLIHGLTRDNIDLFGLLNRLGSSHKNMGVNINHYDPMLNSMHDAFAYYFDIKYGIEIKYAIDQTFTMAARIMTGQDFKESKYAHLQDLDESIKNGQFLQSLPICLASNIGREYLYRFLQQTFCDEIAVFLQSLNKFKSQTSDKERFMTARSIIKNSVRSTATLCVNISYECRSNSINEMKELERMFHEGDNLSVPKDLFKPVENEIYKLILDNHWRKFTETFKKLNENNQE